jgi:hypothetical protein
MPAASDTWRVLAARPHQDDAIIVIVIAAA